MSGNDDTEEVRRTLRNWLAATEPARPPDAGAPALETPADPEAPAHPRDPADCGPLAQSADPGVRHGAADAVEGTGLDVPPAEAAAVTAAVRGLLGLGHARGGLSALLARSSLPAAGFAELRLLARALVVDEHPSAGRWTATERLDAASWVALLLDRYGEDGVQWLVARLHDED